MPADGDSLASSPEVAAAQEPTQLDLAAALSLLGTGELTVQGQLYDASNATLFCAVTQGSVQAACVYKPIAGERPLWDFPDGTLAGREVAAWVVSDATGLQVVPPTVLRDGPFGPGMCQLWIDVDDTVDLVALSRSRHPALRRMALFDAVVNNADRKGGHLLPTPEGHVWGVDHGVTFHVEDKLRTLLWQWRGRSFTDAEVELLGQLRASLSADLRDRLQPLLTRREIAALTGRLDRLLAGRRFPQPSEDWPAIPWPPF